MAETWDVQGNWRHCRACGLQWAEDGRGVESYCDRTDGEWREVPTGTLPAWDGRRTERCDA